MLSSVACGHLASSKSVRNADPQPPPNCWTSTSTPQGLPGAPVTSEEGQPERSKTNQSAQRRQRRSHSPSLACWMTGHSRPLVQAHTYAKSPWPHMLHQSWLLGSSKIQDLPYCGWQAPPPKITKHRGREDLSLHTFASTQKSDQTPQKRHSAHNNCLNHFNSFAEGKHFFKYHFLEAF